MYIMQYNLDFYILSKIAKAINAQAHTPRPSFCWSGSLVVVRAATSTYAEKGTPL